MWWIGDWANYGERQYEDIRQVAQTLGYEPGSFWHAKWVASSIESCRRLQLLPWSHHHEVAALEPEEQSSLLTQAVEGNWSHKQLREVVR